jgi:preprotein translocase subunit SecF
MVFHADMFVVTHRKLFYVLSGIVIGVAVLSILLFGLRFGIDFKGGSLIEVEYPQGRPDVSLVKEAFSGKDAFAGYSIRPTGENGFIVRTPYLTPETHNQALKALSNDGKFAVNEARFDSIGPTIGKELRTKSSLAILLVIICIVLFITFTFRKVSEPVASWKYGLIAIVALIHDVLVPTGVFATLGHFLGTELDTLFVTALLVVLGFSIHDTIVVFDRVRENLKVNREYNKKEPFEETVGKSISQTFNRSINTSLTTILSLLALYFLGSAATKDFSLALIIGIVAGTYSSIFLASPLLVTVEKWQNRNIKR